MPSHCRDRVCFIAPATETGLFLIEQDDTTMRPYVLALAETTMWANWFFTGGGYSSYTLIQNTSAAPIAVTFTWRGADGRLPAPRLWSWLPQGSRFATPA